ncbi:uncharacterized protein DUF481 [Orbus hercynius]|uniref:Uncharacterized protein DUF481 n=2 Tax=Orbus hercynius TaxID=593135 RepID=A0A495RB17_9GAMM|nr:uncharacterized protein DUF481 [Orbus hercynius]
MSASFTALGDTIELKNGDNLSGKIKLVDGSKVLIETEYAGVITVANDKIKTFSIDEPVKIKDGVFTDAQYADAITTADDSKITLVKGENSKTISISDDLTIIKSSGPSSLVPADLIVNGALNAGAYYNKGSSKSEQYSLNGNVTAKYDLWRHGFRAAVFRSKDDQDTSNYYYTTQYDVDRFFTPSFFWQGNAQYKHDWIEDIKTKTSFGTGPGWQVWQDELSALSFTGLISYQKIDYRNGNDSVHPLGSVKWNYYQFFSGKSLKFFTTGEIGRSFNNDVDLDLSATAGLAYRLTDWLSINTSLTREKSTTKDGDSSNTNYNIGVGVNW